MIPHNRPFITTDDIAAVDAVLRSGWLAEGPAVGRLEESFKVLFGGGEACAVSSGTAALFLAIKTLDLEPGCLVAIPSYSCSALLNAVIMAGARPRIVDVRTDTFCIDPVALEAQARDAHCVIAVHVFGASADVAALKTGGRVVLEDCCQSLGGQHAGMLLGTSGAAAVFSFYASKIVTGGQGGLVWARDREFVERVRDYREFDGRATYAPRFNLQMTDIQAALAGSQLTRLEDIRARRAEIARRYLAALPDGIKAQVGLLSGHRMAHRFVAVAPDLSSRERLREHMRSAGIECTVPVEKFELLHRYWNLAPAAFPAAESVSDTTLSLPMHLCLTDDEIAFISSTLQQFRT